MALSAALARAHLLRGSLRPAGFAAAVSPLSYRSQCQLCSTPTANEPSAAGPWDEAEAEILRDVEPVVNLVKDIIHSRRYRNGGFLSPDEEKVVTEKLLSHHPRAEEKIGCGLDGIMVDRHPEFNSRCLFVVRTNGDLEDFSYHKCLRAYLQEKYPSYADKFLKKHLVEKRSKLFRVQKKATMDSLPAGQSPGS